MKTIALLLTFVAAVVGCGHVQAVATDCAAQLVTPTQIQAIEAALSTDNYDNALAGLAIEFGSCVVLAGVQQLSQQPVALAARAVSAPALTPVELVRAKAWLAAHPRGV